MTNFSTTLFVQGCRWILLCSLASGSFLLTAAAKEIDREQFTPIAAGILKVEVVTEAGGYSLGSAVSLGNGKFVTSCHVTAKAMEITLVFQGLRVPVSRQRANTTRDLCVLDAPRLADVPTVPIGSARKLRIGEEVVALGYTFGAGLASKIGSVRALHPIDGSPVIQSATYFNSGASGGGLFTAEGLLVGVLTFRLKGAEAFYFSIPVDWLDEELARQDAYMPIAPLGGPMPFWSQPVDSLPYFMRASTLEARQNWDELIALTERWSESDGNNPEPLLMRGLALMRKDQYAAAAEAFSRSVTLNPRFAFAWLNLGQAQFRLGQDKAVSQTLAELKKLDEVLAAELAVTTGRNVP